MELVKPKSKLEIQIEGTQKLKTPKWLSRKGLTFFVRYFSQGGMIPIDEYRNGFRISNVEGEQLPEEKRRVYFRHARIWQDLLLKEKSDRGAMNSDSNKVDHVSRHGPTARNQSPASPSSSQKVQNLQTRSGLQV